MEGQGCLIYTEQMDAEGLGRKLLLTPPPRPPETPEKQTVGTVTASHKMLTLQALSSSLNASTAKRGCLGREKALEVTSSSLSPKTAPSIYTFRRRTNVQQLTCKINLPFSFYYLFFSFVLLQLKPFVLKGLVLGENYEKCEKL